MSETPPPSPLANPAPWELVASAYASDIVPLFEVFSREALAIAGLGAGQRVVDVACGPGTLSFLAAASGADVSALDFAPEMVALLEARATREGVRAIEARVGNGMDLPYADASFDAGFSMFGLMFFPDRDRGFRELHRVLRPGAKAVVSSWVDLQTLPIMAAAFGALAEVTPPPPNPTPRRPMPLIDRADCIAEMSAGGFADVEVREVVGEVAYASTEAMLDAFVRTNAPIALARRGFGEAWPEIEAKWRVKVAEKLGPGPQRSAMPAHLIVGTKR